MEIDAFSLSVSDLHRGRGYVYSLQYHIVWCTKYRKKVLTGEIEEALKVMLQEICEMHSARILAMETMPDHVHMLVDSPPKLLLPDFIKTLKGISARRIRERYPGVRRLLWGDHFWNPSYCVCTVSDRTREMVSQYILGQKEK